MESRLLNSGQTPPKVSTQIQPYANPPKEADGSEHGGCGRRSSNQLNLAL